MKNKPFLFALIYAALYIAATLYFYLTQNFKQFNLMYVVAMAAIMPLSVLSIKVQKDTVYGGIISGRNAAKEGMKAALYAAIILIMFQAAFYFSGWKEFKTDSIPSALTEQYNKLVSLGKLKPDPKRLQDAITMEINSVTLFKEISTLFFRTMIAGFFSSFLAALFMKTTPGFLPNRRQA